jgi:hypothetical protein
VVAVSFFPILCPRFSVQKRTEEIEAFYLTQIILYVHPEYYFIMII